MYGIKIEVIGNIAKITERPAKITAGTVGLPVVFSFDSQWDKLSKTAVFRAGHVEKIRENLENETTVPWEVLANPNEWLSIGVYGVNADGTVAIPTVWANVRIICDGANTYGDVSAAPSLPIWQKLLNAIGNLLGLTTNAKGNLVEAINEVHNIALAGGIETDKTLSESGKAAEAKATGDAIQKAEAKATRDAIQKSSPYNLLDNSDFRNPVNQKGVTEFTSGQYAIDRWICDLLNFTATLQSDGIHFNGADGGFWLKQRIPLNGSLVPGTKVTMALKKSTGTISGITEIPANGMTNIANSVEEGHLIQLETAADGSYVEYVYFGNNASNEYIVAWAALYEGEYTAENLPVYRPKGYNVELLNCGGYVLGGFGLGTFSAVRSWGEIDNLTLNGWYTLTGEEQDFDGVKTNYAYMHVEAYDTNWVTQTLHLIVPSGAAGLVLKRSRESGTWKPWEWENPPMMPGVEYRTTKRWYGAHVYIKRVDFGFVAPGATASMKHSEYKIHPIHCYGWGSGNALPYFYTDQNYNILIGAAAETVNVSVGSAYTANIDIQVVVEYAKG